MKKILTDELFREGKVWSKLWKIMRLQLLIVFVTLFQLHAETGVAQERVSISFKDALIEDIIKEVEAQSGYVVVYNNTLLKNMSRVTVRLTNVNAKDALNEALKGSGLECKMVDDFLVISKKEGGDDEKKETFRKIKGKVMDEKGITLPGVTVLIKGTTLGVVTDIDGKFSIEVPKMDSTILVFSFVGMVTKEYRLPKDPKDDAKEISIRLQEDVKEMQEVVVTGYANIRKESFTGNSVTVKREDLLKVSKTNVIQALQTFDPSFRIQQNNQWGSDPNNVPELYIRGRSGIGVKDLDRKKNLSKSELENNPNLPTFIMDGFQISVEKLYDMDPNRIESITILKDAAASAMYGSRAANGVVVITTVAPVPGKVSVSYSMTGTVTAPDLTDYNLMNAKEKLEAEVAAGIYKAANYSDQNKYDVEYNGKLNNVAHGVDTYWLAKPLQTAFNHKHSLYIEGGTNDIRFGLDMLYNNEDGVMKKSYRDRMGVGFYIDYRIGSFQVKNYISYNITRSEESPYGTFSDYTSKQPYDEYKDADGNYLKQTFNWHGGSSSELKNPLYEAGLKSFNKSQVDELINNLSANWYVNNYLQIKGQFSLTKKNTKSDDFIDPKSMRNGKVLSAANSSSGELRTSAGDGFDWDLNAFLAYNRTISGHNINLNIGINATSTHTSTTSAFYRGFPSGSLHSPNYAQEIVEKPTVSQNSTRLFGVLGSLNYTYNNIYLLDLSVRTDGSSEFGSDKRFAPFWSGGLGINLHNYEFMKKYGYIDVLKIRGSYGVTGKVNFRPYAAQTIYQILSEEWYKTGFGASLMALGNKELAWEKTKELDLGIDVQLFNGGLQMEFSYYRKKTIDLINDVTIESAAGFTTYMDNLGEVMNKGYEIQLKSDVFRNNDWYVSVFGNLAHNKNEILKVSESLKAYNDAVDKNFAESNAYDGSTSKPITKYQEGGSLTSIYAMKSLGIDPATGQEMLVNRDGSVTYTWNSSEQVVVGNTEPKAQGTFGFNVNYKNFTLYTTFMYEFGGQQYNQTLVDKVENANLYTSNVDKRVFTNRWKKPGDKAKFKALETGRNGIETTNPTERFVQDYNVVTLNSITLGYDFNSELIKKAHLGMLRLEVGANDLFRISSVKAERGLSYPFARSVNFSIKATF